MLWLALFALSLIAAGFAWCACILAGRADDTSDDFARQLADTDDAWLSAVASGCDSVAGSSRGEAGAGDVRGRGAISLSHRLGDSE